MMVGGNSHLDRCGEAAVTGNDVNGLRVICRCATVGCPETLKVQILPKYLEEGVNGERTVYRLAYLLLFVSKCRAPRRALMLESNFVARQRAWSTSSGDGSRSSLPNLCAKMSAATLSIKSLLGIAISILSDFRFRPPESGRALRCRGK